jgi:hypothetical protein
MAVISLGVILRLLCAEDFFLSKASYNAMDGKEKRSLFPSKRKKRSFL